VPVLEDGIENGSSGKGFEAFGIVGEYHLRLWSFCTRISFLTHIFRESTR
jgi:hypothetical protein